MAILLLAMVSGRFTNIEQLKQTIVFGLPAVVIALTLHEFAHAFAADRFGDPTPRLQGRLSLDIRKHIEPVGLILFIFTGFGWAKPVMTDTRNLKNPKTDMALIALAGPLMNIFLFAITIMIASKLKIGIDETSPLQPSKLTMLLYYVANYNISFAVFNLLPIPPLDGSKIFKGFLSTKFYLKYSEFEFKYQGFLTMGLLAIIFFMPGVIGSLIEIIAEPVAIASLYIASYFPF